MPKRQFDLGDVLENILGVGHPLTHISARIREENCTQYSVTGEDWINEADLERFGVPAAFYRFRRILQGNMVITMEDREGTYHRVDGTKPEGEVRMTEDGHFID